MVEKSIGDAFWNGVFIQPLGGNGIFVENKEYVLTPNIQKYFSNTKLTIKSLKKNEKEIVFDFLTNVGFYDVKHIKGLNSASIRNTSYNLPKTIKNILNLPLPQMENIEEPDNLQGDGIEKVIIPTNLIDIYLH